jgi:hypothetical protein
MADAEGYHCVANPYESLQHENKGRLRERSQTTIEIRIKLMIIYHYTSVARRSFRAKVLLP